MKQLKNSLEEFNSRFMQAQSESVNMKIGIGNYQSWGLKRKNEEKWTELDHLK